MKKSTRITVYEKFGGHCAYCGEVIKYRDMQVDHIISQANWLHHILNNHKVPKFLNHLKETDIDHIDNLHPACRTCNLWKRDYHLEAFRSDLEDNIRKANAYSTNYRMAKRYGLVVETPKPIVFYFESAQFKQNPESAFERGWNDPSNNFMDKL